MNKKTKIQNLNNYKFTKKEKIGLINGKFRLIHQGHLRLIKFASEICNYLVIAIEIDNEDKNLDKISKGLEILNLIENIKLITYYKENEFENLIQKIKPRYLIKGKEFEDKISIETELAKKYKIEILFSSSDEKFLFDELEDTLNKSSKTILNTDNKVQIEINNFCIRHSINISNIKNKLIEFKNKKIVIIGDTIVDIYNECTPVGMSQEDPTIVVTKNTEKRFIGGAAIIAAHASALGANASLYSVCGDDDLYNFTDITLKKYRVNTNILVDKTRPTTSKIRYKANGKTLLRVNNYKSHSLSGDLNKIFLKRIINDIKDIDLLIFADFSYGLLSDSNIKIISNICKKMDIPIVADSQSSSQIGNITKFNDTLLITPTEFEARTSLNDSYSGLAILCDKLFSKTNSKYVVITLGSEGLIASTNQFNDKRIVDNLSAFNKNAIDVAGAGDCLLVTMSLGLVCGMNIWEALLLGNSAAASQVSRIGNIPITLSEINKYL